MIDLTTKSGKYRMVFDAAGKMTIYRHGEEWITDAQGQKMLIELCCELEDARTARANVHLSASAPDQNAALIAAPEPPDVGTRYEAQRFLEAYGDWFRGARKRAIAKSAAQREPEPVREEGRDDKVRDVQAP